jgi:hypothetical protein
MPERNRPFGRTRNSKKKITEFWSCSNILAGISVAIFRKV